MSLVSKWDSNEPPCTCNHIHFVTPELLLLWCSYVMKYSPPQFYDGVPERIF